MKITPHFTREELQCHCGCGKMPWFDRSVWRLEALRIYLDFPLPINSGYRCPVHDADVHRERNPSFSAAERWGAHTVEGENLTVDLGVFGRSALLVVQAAPHFGFTGVGVHQRGEQTKRFIHLDCLESSLQRPRPWIYTY